jgi:hypothetical protein
MSRGAIVSFTLSIGVASVAAAGLRKGALEHALAGERYEDVYYLPPADWLPAFSLGWDEALADLLWIRALIYFSDEFLSQGALTHVFDYTEAMLALDPDFRAVYRWIGTAGIYRPHEVSPEEIRRSVAIMRRGLDRFPDDGELAWAIGASLAFELAPLLTDRREREAVRAEGAEYLMMAARLGAAPEWAVLSNAAILDRIGRADAAARHLEEMYARVNDEGVRARIAAALAQLRSQVQAEAFVEAERVEEARRLREYPWVRPDLYFLLGPRPVVPWRETYRRGFASLVKENEIVVLQDGEEEP